MNERQLNPRNWSMIRLGEVGGTGGLGSKHKASGMTYVKQRGRLNTPKPPSPQSEGAQQGEMSSNTPTNLNQIKKFNLWIFQELALLCNFAAFLCLFYPKLHSFPPEDDILDPSGHNLAFSSGALLPCCDCSIQSVNTSALNEQPEQRLLMLY